MSEPYDGGKYLATVDAILSVADLELITVKRIRNALQELFGVDLLPHKKQINDLIKNRYWDLADKRKAESDANGAKKIDPNSSEEHMQKSEKQRLKEIEKKDALLAARLQRMDSKRYSTRSVDKPRDSKKVVKKRELSTKQKSTGFNKEMALSTELAEVVGIPACSRPQVVKLMWKYIKENELQDPNDKRKIVCDDRLRTLFKKSTVGAFEMNKILSKHIFPKDDSSDRNGTGVATSTAKAAAAAAAAVASATATSAAETSASSEEPPSYSELLEVSDVDSP